MNAKHQCVLSIDIGTTAIKLCLLTIHKPHNILQAYISEHNATVKCDNTLYHEQDSIKIVTTVTSSIKRLLYDNNQYTISDIVLTGQMHSMCLWSYNSVQQYHNNTDLNNVQGITHLITWLDKRCNNDTIDTTNVRTDDTIHTGYGNYTLTYLNQQDVIDLTQYNAYGSIVDLLYCVLAYDNNQYINKMHPSMGASFGMYNNKHDTWNIKLINQYDKGYKSRHHVLPHIAYKHIQQVNEYCKQLLQCTDVCNIHIGIGDATSQYYGLCEHTTDCLINIGTSMQLTILANMNTIDINNIPDTLELRPGINTNSKLLVCASLNGGNVYEHLAKQYAHYTQCTLNEAYDILNTQGEQYINTCNVPIIPTLYGERHDPSAKLQFDDIIIDTDDNVPFADIPSKYTIGNISASVCRALIQNLYNMSIALHATYYQHIQRIILCGTAVTHHKMYLASVEQIFQLPVLVMNNEQSQYAACIGAASVVDQT